MTALHHAAENERDADVMEFICNHYQFDIHATNNLGYSVLHCTSKKSNFEICEFLLKRGAMVNGQEGHCVSPISLAVSPQWSESLEQFITERQIKTVKVLLEYGANVTREISGRRFLEDAFRNTSEDLRKILMQHVARMLEYPNSSIDVDDLQVIANNGRYREYYQTCVQEFKRMKETKLYNNVTIFNIFINSGKAISAYAKNEELVKALEEEDYDSMFPMYFAWLKERFHKEVKKQRLRKGEAKILSDIFMFNDPFNPIIWNILSYLSDEHLKFLH